jgi:hypothetical protein
MRNIDPSDMNAVNSWKGKNSSVPTAILDGLINTWKQNKKNGVDFNQYFSQDKKGEYSKQFFGDIIADRISNGSSPTSSGVLLKFTQVNPFVCRLYPRDNTPIFSLEIPNVSNWL